MTINFNQPSTESLATSTAFRRAVKIALGCLSRYIVVGGKIFNLGYTGTPNHEELK